MVAFMGATMPLRRASGKVGGTQREIPEAPGQPTHFRRSDDMAITGGCHCGAIRYEAEGEAITHALCHCTDCRRSAGAPMGGWTMDRLDSVKVTKGAPKIYESSEHGRRHFCPNCGSGLFYTNAKVLP